ncbi:hypothetical protein F4808DRAFT_159633 [Astrocystis sublimbata]|nr:hypothetical protein F4808DRAFT_159633 [Astrocystis sublimbata]
MAANSQDVSPNTYEMIETWAGQQKQMPLPVSDKVRGAVLDLEHALKLESIATVEPELSDTNWIGLLMEYRAAHPWHGCREVSFIESSSDLTGRGILRWKCQVTLGEAPPGQLFPSHEAAEQTFAKKKDAKRYACKTAVEWLRASGFMPQDGGVKWPKGITAPALQSTQQQQQQLAQSPLATNTTPSHPSAIQSPRSDTSQPSAVQQASELCQKMGIPSPTYILEPADFQGHFFNGYADFGAHNPFLAFDISPARVKSILGKPTAKEAVAKILLKILQEEREKRAAKTEAFLAQGKSAD